MTHRAIGPVVERLGCVPIIRSGDYKYYDAEPTVEEQKEVTRALIDRSVDHMKNSDSTLVIFPPGTKGNDKLREGVGLVLGRVLETTVIPIAMVSSSQDKKTIRMICEFCLANLS